MALDKKQIAEILKLYNGGEGDDVPALATAYEVSPAAIMYHLKKAGVYQSSKADPERPSDEDLGIGEDDESAAPVAASPSDLESLLKNPALAALVDAAVTARLSQIGAPIASDTNGTDSVRAIVKSMERMIEVQALQQPGYIKPISASEMDKRLNARVEMFAQIEHAKKQYAETNNKNLIPHYILGEQFFECANAILYEEGQEIRTFLPPAEKFVPMNETARNIHAAMMTWIGGDQPDIGARIAEAMTAVKGDNIPMITGTAPSAAPNVVEIVPSSKRHDVKPSRVLGTITPETRGTPMAAQPGITQQPAGPVFVGS